MKILYISPVNTVGTLSIWKKEHELNGHTCRFLTFFRTNKFFENDICLDLPFNFSKPYLNKIRQNIFKIYRGKSGYQTGKNGFPPKWGYDGFLDKSFIGFKELIWKQKIYKAIDKYHLYDFDVVHFESGMDFLKNEFFVKELNRRGKKIIAHYHGEDLRSRGVMPLINKFSSLNLTNELDLLQKHPNINYLFLPYSFNPDIKRKTSLNKKIIVCHSPTNRYYKGSKIIIEICRRLESKRLIQFDLVENEPHSITMQRKAESDIFIDQVGDKGGWGYGMNSIESLSLGICTLTEVNKKYQEFIPDNPFINVNNNNLEEKLISLIAKPDTIIKFGKIGFSWVRENHDIKSVIKKLYNYYQKIGLS